MQLIHLTVVAALAEAATYTDYYYALCAKITSSNRAIVQQCNPADQLCLCGNSDFQTSVLSCIVYASDMADLDGKATRQSWHAFHDTCAAAGGRKLPPIDHAVQKLLERPPRRSWEDANSTGSLGPFLASERQITASNVVNAGKALYTESWAADKYGQALFEYVMGIFGIATMVNLASWVTPGLSRMIANSTIGRGIRRWVMLPALWRRYKAEPIVIGRGLWFVFPSRLTSIALAGYLILTGVLAGIHHPVEISPLLYPTGKIALLAGCGRRVIVFAMYNSVLVFLFAGRNNVLLWLSGVSYDVVNVWHRWVARLLIAEVIVHAGLHTEWIRFFHALAYYWTLPYIQWGFVALILMALMSIQGTKSVRRLSYDIFKFTHVLFAAITIVGSWRHIAHHRIGRGQLIACYSIWGFDHLVRLVRTVRSGIASARICVVPGQDEIIEVTVQYSGAWQPHGGDYVFIQFLTRTHFWRSHPFTVVETTSGGGIKLMCKAREGLTRHMLDLDGQTVRVLLDGPYGQCVNTKPFDEIVLIAGGIGVTAVYSHLVHALRTNANSQRLTVHWLVTTPQPLRWFQEHLEILSRDNRVQVVVHVTRDDQDSSVDTKHSYRQTVETASIEWGKPSVTTLVQDAIQQSQGPTCFFVCGPGCVNDEVREAVVDGISLTRNYIQFYEETFAM